jgi:hypothetical protein
MADFSADNRTATLEPEGIDAVEQTATEAAEVTTQAAGTARLT